MEFIGILLLIQIGAWGIIITSNLITIKKKINNRNIIEEQNSEYLRQIINKIEIDNYKKSW